MQVVVARGGGFSDCGRRQVVMVRAEEGVF